MPKAKPVSLHPLSLEEAITALIRASPKLDELHKKTKKLKVSNPPL